MFHGGNSSSCLVLHLGMIVLTVTQKGMKYLYASLCQLKKLDSTKCIPLKTD